MAIIIVLLIISIISFLLFRHISVEMGRKPKGERLERILKSENYQNEVFQNTEETLMDRPPYEGIKEMMKKREGQKPAKALPTLPIDKKRYEHSDSAETLMTWLGHSTLLIKTNGVIILIDPVFSNRASLFQRVGPKKFDYSQDYTYADLPEIDIVLLTHDHYDHLDSRAIMHYKSKVKKFIMPLGVGAHLEHWGVAKEKIEEYDWWEKTTFMGVEFTATPGRHFTGRLFSDRFKTLWCGWAIKSENSNIYFSGDSGFFKGFKTIGEKLGPFDFAFMECGQYSKYWPAIHMMPEESLQAALDVKSSVAMPVHWGKFKLSIHNWNEPPIRFLQRATEIGLKVATPKIGQTFSLKDIPSQPWWN